MFAAAGPNPSLGTLLDLLLASDLPVSLSVSGAGPATTADLAAADWDAAFVRWEEPEIHDVWYLEHGLTASDEAAQVALAAACAWVNSVGDRSLQAALLPMLLAVQSVYTIAVLPAMTADDDHPAWEAFAELVEVVASACGGVVYAPEEGFYDAQGVLIGDLTMEAEPEQE